MIRPATPADIPALVALEQELFGADAWSEELIRQEIEGPGRTFVVSQVRGRTDIILQNGRTYFLTSPAAQLERAVRNERVPQLDPWREIRVSEAEALFRTEIDFWLNRVGKVSERWPLELIP